MGIKVDVDVLSQYVKETIQSGLPFAVKSIKLSEEKEEPFLFVMCATSMCCSVVPFRVLYKYAHKLLDKKPEKNEVKFRVQSVEVTYKRDSKITVGHKSVRYIFETTMPDTEQHFFILHEHAVAELTSDGDVRVNNQCGYSFELEDISMPEYGVEVLPCIAKPEKDVQFEIIPMILCSEVFSFSRSERHFEVRNLLASGVPKYSGHRMAEVLFIKGTIGYYVCPICTLSEAIRLNATEDMYEKGYISAYAYGVTMLYDCDKGYLSTVKEGGDGRHDMILPVTMFHEYRFSGGDTIADLKYHGAIAGGDYQLMDIQVMTLKMPLVEQKLKSVIDKPKPNPEEEMREYIESQSKEDRTLVYVLVGVCVGLFSVIIDRILFRRKR